MQVNFFSILIKINFLKIVSVCKVISIDVLENFYSVKIEKKTVHIHEESISIQMVNVSSSHSRIPTFGKILLIFIQSIYTSID